MRIRFFTNLFASSLITRWSNDPQIQQIIAGARNAEGGFADSMEIVEEQLAQWLERGTDSTPESSLTNTTIAVVATNIKLTKSKATKVAQMAYDGLARTIRPIHTLSDGDAIFALSLGEYWGNASLVGAIAAYELIGEQKILQRVAKWRWKLYNGP